MRRLRNGTPGLHKEIILDGGMAHHRVVQANRDAIMDRNRELRKTRDAVKTTTFGKLEFDIPLQDMAFLDSQFPGLANPGHPDHRWQLRRFMASPVSAPYRITESRRGPNSGHIIS